MDKLTKGNSVLSFLSSIKHMSVVELPVWEDRPQLSPHVAFLLTVC